MITFFLLQFNLTSMEFFCFLYDGDNSMSKSWGTIFFIYKAHLTLFFKKKKKKKKTKIRINSFILYQKGRKKGVHCSTILNCAILSTALKELPFLPLPQLTPYKISHCLSMSNNHINCKELMVRA